MKKKVVIGLCAGLSVLCLAGCGSSELETVETEIPTSETITQDLVQEVVPEIDPFEEVRNVQIITTDEPIPSTVEMYDLLFNAYNQVISKPTLRTVTVNQGPTRTQTWDVRWNLDTHEYAYIMADLHDNPKEDLRITDYLVLEDGRYVSYSLHETKQDDEWVFYKTYNSFDPTFAFWLDNDMFKFPYFLSLSDTYVEFNGEKCYQVKCTSDEVPFAFWYDLYIKASDGSLYGESRIIDEQSWEITIHTEDERPIIVPDSVREAPIEDLGKEPVTEAPDLSWDWGNTPIRDYATSISNPGLKLGDVVGVINDSVTENFLYKTSPYRFENGKAFREELEEDALILPGELIMYERIDPTLFAFNSKHAKIYCTNNTDTPCTPEECNIIGYAYDNTDLKDAKCRCSIIDLMVAWGYDYKRLNLEPLVDGLCWDKGDYKLFVISEGGFISYIYILHDSMMPTLYERLNARYKMPQETFDNFIESSN